MGEYYCVLFLWGQLCYNTGRLVFQYGASCLSPSFYWGELSRSEFPLGRAVLGQVVFGQSCPDSIQSSLDLVYDFLKMHRHESYHYWISSDSDIQMYRVLQSSKEFQKHMIFQQRLTTESWQK